MGGACRGPANNPPDPPSRASLHAWPPTDHTSAPSVQAKRKPEEYGGKPLAVVQYNAWGDTATRLAEDDRRLGDSPNSIIAVNYVGFSGVRAEGGGCIVGWAAGVCGRGSWGLASLHRCGWGGRVPTPPPAPHAGALDAQRSHHGHRAQEARARGVKRYMRGAEALKICPDLILIQARDCLGTGTGRGAGLAWPQPAAALSASTPAQLSRATHRRGPPTPPRSPPRMASPT